MSYHFLLASRVSVERPTVSLMGILLYILCYFSLTAFNICPLCLIFLSLISMCLGMFILYGTLGFLDLYSYFLSHVREIFNYNLKYFSSLLLLCSSKTCMIQMLCLMLSHRSLRLSSLLFVLFFFIVFYISYFNILSSSSLIHSSASVTLLLIPSSVFLISVMALSIVDCLFFKSSKSLLNISCIFLIHASILFSRF